MKQAEKYIKYILLIILSTHTVNNIFKDAKEIFLKLLIYVYRVFQKYVRKLPELIVQVKIMVGVHKKKMYVNNKIVTTTQFILFFFNSLNNAYSI